MHLCSFLASESGSHFIKNKQVLELGAGTGLVSILCAKCLDPKFVRCTDGNEGVVEAISENLFVNGMETHHCIEPRPLLWGRAIPAYGDETPRAFDTILGADVVSILLWFLIKTDYTSDLWRDNISVLALYAERGLSDQSRGKDSHCSYHKEPKNVWIVSFWLWWVLKSVIVCIKARLNNCTAKAKFSAEEITFDVPTEENQQGPFYSSTNPIRIVLLRADVLAKINSFSVWRTRRGYDIKVYRWRAPSWYLSMVIIQSVLYIIRYCRVPTASVWESQ
jgi:hypothetical protein